MIDSATTTLMTTLILTILIVAIAVALTVIFAGIRPMRVVRQWLAALANGEAIPDAQESGAYSWMLPLHREAGNIAATMTELREGSKEMQAKLEEVEFLQHFILGSLIEGVMVVNSMRRVTLVNSEFLNLFPQEQSPLNQTVNDLVPDKKLEELITEAFETRKVCSGRVSKQSTAAGGRPPSFEVSTIPVRSTETSVHSVVVLFLPPPDRTRMVQILKSHSEKLHRLANEWTIKGGVRLRTTIADLPDHDYPLLPETTKVQASEEAPSFIKNGSIGAGHKDELGKESGN